MVERSPANAVKNEENREKLTLKHIIPSMITLLNGFSGLLSIYLSVYGNYLAAIFWIFTGFFADTLDGPVARRLNATSKFGAELDSMCDIITFGVAPFMLLFTLNNFYIIIAFGYVLCVIIRLARFGAIPSPPCRHLGLASPMAAIFVASTVGLCIYFHPIIAIIFINIVTIASSILMVSPREYHKILAAASHRNRVLDWALWLSTWVILIIWLIFNYNLYLIIIIWVVSAGYAIFLSAPFLKWDEKGNLFPK